MALRLIEIIGLYLLGIVGIVGCFCGAKHHAMTAGVCVIFGTLLLQEWVRDYRELRRKGGLTQ